MSPNIQRPFYCDVIRNEPYLQWRQKKKGRLSQRTLIFQSRGACGENFFDRLQKEGMVIDYTIEYIYTTSSKISLKSTYLTILIPSRPSYNQSKKILHRRLHSKILQVLATETKCTEIVLLAIDFVPLANGFVTLAAGVNMKTRCSGCVNILYNSTTTDINNSS